jgi:Tetratricopeptide Repeats-Sensor
MPDPIAFVVMPFDRKSTGIAAPGVPVEVDFDALWVKVYKPILEELGYQAVRADRDVGALVINEMIQRLAIADLVVADITLPNANVYYEVGVRHAAQREGCVLLAAEWAIPVFDVVAMRRLRFPLPEGDITDATAEAALAALRGAVQELAGGESPVFTAVPGFPTPDEKRATAFTEAVAQLADFEADVLAVRAAPTAEERRERVEALLDTYGRRPVVRDVVALALMRLVRDHLGFEEVLDCIATFPAKLAAHPLVLEYQAHALSETGNIPKAVGRLETLIAGHGETPERLGLLGGRYKRLYRDTRNCEYLDKAIGAYERGWELDLNAYYAASNLPRLYRIRGRDGDERRAQEAEVATALACRAAIKNGTADEWARTTLLGSAFDRGHVAEAETLAGEVESEGAAKWQLRTTIDDLRASVAAQPDAQVRAGLQAVLDELEALLRPRLRRP